MSVIVLEEVSRWYGTVLGLSRVNLSLDKGVTALLGPNGAGKSTMIRLVTGLLQPSFGRVRVFDESPFANPRVHARLGLVPEEEDFRARVTGRDWLIHLLRLGGMDSDAAHKRASEAVEQVGLSQVAHRQVATYSRGMRQRLRVAQAMAHDPELIVLDEPLTGLDPVGRREVIDWIREWGASGKLVLVSSHILHEVEMMTQQVVLMTAGRVLADGNVHEIRRLMDAHPHRIHIQTPTPKKLATRLMSFDGLLSISFSEENQRVQLETGEPDRFYRLLADLVLDEDVTINELTSPDDNLEAIFHYLVES